MGDFMKKEQGWLIIFSSSHGSPEEDALRVSAGPNHREKGPPAPFFFPLQPRTESRQRKSSQGAQKLQ